MLSYGAGIKRELLVVLIFYFRSADIYIENVSQFPAYSRLSKIVSAVGLTIVMIDRMSSRYLDLYCLVLESEIEDDSGPVMTSKVKTGAGTSRVSSKETSKVVGEPTESAAGTGADPAVADGSV